jgi:hypothetical protein
MSATVLKPVPAERVGGERANMLGRPKIDLRLGNPSPDVSSSYIPSLLPGDRRRAVWWRGRIQFETLSILMVDKDVVSIREDEPGFRWTDGFAHYVLRPKFVVGRRDGSRNVVAVNWARDVVEHRLLTALAHAKSAARQAGYDDIEVWTDVQTRRPGRLANAEMLYGAAVGKFDPVLLETLRAAAHRAGGPVSIRALRLACGRPDEALRAAFRLVWDGDLARADPDGLISDDTVVTASSLTR